MNRHLLWDLPLLVCGLLLGSILNLGNVKFGVTDPDFIIRMIFIIFRIYPKKWEFVFTSVGLVSTLEHTSRAQQIRPVGIWKKVKGNKGEGGKGKWVGGEFTVLSRFGGGRGGREQEPGQPLDRPPDRFSGNSRT